jgi:hypothetical protein
MNDIPTGSALRLGKYIHPKYSAISYYAVAHQYNNPYQGTFSVGCLVHDSLEIIFFLPNVH